MLYEPYTKNFAVLDDPIERDWFSDLIRVSKLHLEGYLQDGFSVFLGIVMILCFSCIFFDGFFILRKCIKKSRY